MKNTHAKKYIYAQLTELRVANQNLNAEVGRLQKENSQQKEELTQRFEQINDGKRNAN